MAIKVYCKYCGKVANERSRQTIGKLVYISLECAHLIMEDVVAPVSGREVYAALESTDGARPFDFQVENIEFGEKAGLRFLNADEMGLGKTVVSALLLRLHHAKMLPTLIVCKARLKRQWFQELIRWVGFDKEGKPIILPQIIDSTSQKPYLDIFNAVIVSFDSLSERKNRKGEYVQPEWVHEAGRFRSVIIDETQMIKNPTAARTLALRAVCVGVPYIIGNSGTPIKNNAREYFTILNLLRPEMFNNEAAFLTRWTDSYSTAYGVKTGGIKRSMIEEFKRVTSEFVVRHKRVDVLPNLPQVFRQYSYHDLGEKVAAEYQRELDKFNEAYDEYEASSGAKRTAAFGNVLAYMSKMRHLTGMAKVEPVSDMVADFLMETDRKIAIFHHHQDVGDALEVRLANLCKMGGFMAPLRLKSGISENETENIKKLFKTDPRYRILILRTLAEGEGLNLQECSDVYQMERQWNPANEEQAEARFPRPGTKATRVDATYFLATGTIDEHLTELVEYKRKICRQTMGGEETSWIEESLLKELADKIRTSGRKKWSWK